MGTPVLDDSLYLVFCVGKQKVQIIDEFIYSPGHSGIMYTLEKYAL